MSLNSRLRKKGFGKMVAKTFACGNHVSTTIVSLGPPRAALRFGIRGLADPVPLHSARRALGGLPVRPASVTASGPLSDSGCDRSCSRSSSSHRLRKQAEAVAFGVSGIAGRATVDGRVLALGHMRHHPLRPHGSNKDLRVVTPAAGQRAGMETPFPHTARSPGTASFSVVLVAWLTVKSIINRT